VSPWPTRAANIACLHGEHADDGWTGRHIISDRPADDVRVVTWPDDGHRVKVIGWSPSTPVATSSREQTEPGRPSGRRAPCAVAR
jgi:hypothetical protein